MQEMKRRRITQACDRCRALKSKCDGKRPLCTRCKAYGYSCNWQEGKRRGPPRTNPLTTATSISPGASAVNVAAAEAELQSLRSAIQLYDELAVQLRARLSDGEKAEIDSALTRIRMGLPHELLHTERDPTLSLGSETPCVSPEDLRERYLGEASDVRFLNSVKCMFQNYSSLDPVKLESYETETTTTSNDCLPPELPSREEADKYLDRWMNGFNTNHAVHCEQAFREEYCKFWENRSTEGLEPDFLPTLWKPPSLANVQVVVADALAVTIFALGDLQENFAATNSTRVHKHRTYYATAWLAFKRLDTVFTRGMVNALLMQGLYLLGTLQTDRCWMTLRLAISMAHVVGLHVVDEVRAGKQNVVCSEIDKELRRRTWYSAYSLDCALSLQMGRPRTIRLRDSVVNLPALQDFSLFDYENDRLLPMPSGPHPGHLRIEVIRFSHIVGQVIDDLYSPQQSSTACVNMGTIELLDTKLLKWRQELPRHLRFDLGHAFETQEFEQQRNMLALKFYHLRALIHRPHLSPDWRSKDSAHSAATSEQMQHQIVASARTCIDAAQATARVLHNVPDEHCLVKTYPWWQLVPYIVCACSVLLVASKSAPHPSYSEQVSREQLEADATNCLRTLDAMSHSSLPARQAAEMLRALQACPRPDASSAAAMPTELQSIHGRQQHRPLWQAQSGTHAAAQTLMRMPDQHLRPPIVPSNATAATSAPHPHQDPFLMTEQWHEWPVDYFDSMMWSSQFVLPVQGSAPDGPWPAPAHSHPHPHPGAHNGGQ